MYSLLKGFRLSCLLCAFYLALSSAQFAQRFQTLSCLPRAFCFVPAYAVRVLFGHSTIRFTFQFDTRKLGWKFQFLYPQKEEIQEIIHHFWISVNPRTNVDYTYLTQAQKCPFCLARQLWIYAKSPFRILPTELTGENWGVV